MFEPQLKGCFSQCRWSHGQCHEEEGPGEALMGSIALPCEERAQPSTERAQRAGALLKPLLCGTFLFLKAIHIMLEQEWEMPCLGLPVVRAKNDPISSRTGLGLLLLPTGTLPPPPDHILFLIQLLRGMERGRGGCCPGWKSKEHCFLIMSIVLPSWIIIILHLISFFFLNYTKALKPESSW